VLFSKPFGNPLNKGRIEFKILSKPLYLAYHKKAGCDKRLYITSKLKFGWNKEFGFHDNNNKVMFSPYFLSQKNNN
jgi:hypothetical protein